ncbi:MAG: CRISPR-associated protein Csx16 [Pseudomonadales bacterium]|nr:CRISPR-associated protein Csx16 [Pseudomonadales bacterium]
MTTWFVGRHEGAKAWIMQQGIQIDNMVTHLGPEDVVQKGDTVVGTLPMNLAAHLYSLGARYLNLSLEIPENLRGQELTAEMMHQCHARLQHYEVKEVVATIKTPITDHSQQVNQSNVSQEYLPIAQEAEPIVAQVLQNTGLEDKKLIASIFKFASYSKSAENDRLIKDLVVQAKLRPSIFNQAEDALKQGREANQIWTALKRKTQGLNSDTTIRDLVKQEMDALKRKGEFPRMISYLHRESEKHLAWVAKKEQAKAQLKKKELKPEVKLCGPVFVDGHHPNSLRHLATAESWDVYIDETGSIFSEGDEGKGRGKHVALVVPCGTKLPPINVEFHATKASHAEINKALQSLLNLPVGIVGVSLDDDVLLGQESWFAMVYHTIRLVLRLLPMTPGQETQVRFHVEQREPFVEGTPIESLRHTIEPELRVLSPERYAGLSVHLEIVAKNKLQGLSYVDAIAHTWGSGDSEPKKRLKISQWEGHCLLLPQISSLQRSYGLLDGSKDEVLDAETWFDMVQYLGVEPQGSLVSEIMARLGDRARLDVALWKACLSEVTLRLRQKNFDLKSLVPAVRWLQNFQPEQEHVPARIKLEALSVSISADNHRGLVQSSDVVECLSLGNTLMDEDIRLVCQSQLRVAISLTNVFEFERADQILRPWLAMPVSSLGLELRGKLLSSLGQIYAFRQLSQEAMSAFNEALQVFGRLSDPVDRDRLARQTRNYRAQLQLDLGLFESADWPRLLGKNPESFVGFLIHATDDAEAQEGQRFEHYLLLRAAVLNKESGQYLKNYLKRGDDWYVGWGHPWPLIDFYRAWLLRDTDPALGKVCLQRAVDACNDDQGITMQWMGWVMAAMGQSWGWLVEVNRLADLKPLQLKNLPWADLERMVVPDISEEERIELLKRSLPFNFH